MEEKRVTLRSLPRSVLAAVAVSVRDFYRVRVAVVSVNLREGARDVWDPWDPHGGSGSNYLMYEELGGQASVEFGSVFGKFGEKNG